MISRKKSLFLSVSVLILFVALVAQSCSSENDDFVANPNSSLEMRANLESMDNRATIVNLSSTYKCNFLGADNKQ